MPGLPETWDKVHSRLTQRLGGFRGYVDGVVGGEIAGWVQPRQPGQETPRVGVFVQGARIVEAPANIRREDLDQAGIGGGHGFAIPLTPELTRLIAANGGAVELRVLSGEHSAFLGRLQVSAGTGRGPEALPLRGSALQKRLYGDLELLSKLRAVPAPAPQGPPRCAPAQARLFSSQDARDPDRALPAPMFAYTEFVRSRNRVDHMFDPAARPEDVAHFFKFYLSAYAPMRRGLRVPLSAEAIDWLNEPVVLGGQPRHLSRACWNFLTEVHPILHAMNFANPDWYAWAVYWWSVNQAQAIGCEDCLVPDYFVETLRRVPERWQGESYAPSEFMLRMHAETPELSDLPLERESGRRDLTCALLIMGLSRPDTLRYLPPAALEAALAPPTAPEPRTALQVLRHLAAPDSAETALAHFCTALGRPQPGLTRAAYAAALRHQGFDLDGLRFATRTAEGHRLEAARLPAPAGPPVDIQVIGPVHKASGLGQATRLSAAMLERTLGQGPAGRTLNTVDYALDNPAPEGFNAVRESGDYRPARVNLFHINAESLPLSVAYQPEVMAGAYNIGYVFWELDSPAACHFLGMDLLDEIWVSTDYGVEIYQPHTDKPVVNVGMSFEALPEIPRAEARAYLAETAGVTPGQFTFMVTFDSFSFVQRKNPLGVLSAFAEAFPDDPGVRLVIKTQNRSKVADPVQVKIWQAVDAALAADPRIVLIDETLQYADLLRLKKGADAYISLHRSEGWGFGMIEAMNLGVPVLATGYSGNMDFCDAQTCWLVDYKLVELGPDDYIFVTPGQRWAEPDTRHAAAQMRALHADPRERARRAEAARRRVQTAFSEAAIGRRYAARMSEILTTLEAAQKVRA